MRLLSPAASSPLRIAPSSAQSEATGNWCWLPAKPGSQTVHLSPSQFGRVSCPELFVAGPHLDPWKARLYAGDEWRHRGRQFDQIWPVRISLWWKECPGFSSILTSVQIAPWSGCNSTCMSQSHQPHLYILANGCLAVRCCWFARIFWADSPVFS